MEKTAGKEKQFGIWAVRSSASVCGAAQAWVKRDGKPEKFDTYEEAASMAESYNRECHSRYVHYCPKEMELTSDMERRIGLKETELQGLEGGMQMKP